VTGLSLGIHFKGPFIATQLNSTSSWVELRRRSVYSDADATQLNSTDLFRADWLYASTGSVALPIVGDNCVGEGAIATQLNSTQLAINGQQRVLNVTTTKLLYDGHKLWMIGLRAQTGFIMFLLTKCQQHSFIHLLKLINTRSAAVAERPRDVSCLVSS